MLGLCRPYFLPCLVTAVLAVITLVLSIIFVDETLPSLAKSPSKRSGAVFLDHPMLLWGIQCSITSRNTVAADTVVCSRHCSHALFHAKLNEKGRDNTQECQRIAVIVTAYAHALIAGVVELREQSLDIEESTRLLAAKQRKQSARSFMEFQAGPDAISETSSSEGEH